MKIDRARFLAIAAALTAACQEHASPPTAPVIDMNGATVGGAPTPMGETLILTCDDSHGNPPACSTMNDPGPACEGFDLPRAQCDGFVVMLKGRLSEVFAKCMTDLSSDDVCDASRTYKCKEDALRMACPDPTAVAFCAHEAQARQLAEEQQRFCLASAPGLADDARQALAQCGFTTSCLEALGGEPPPPAPAVE